VPNAGDRLGFSLYLRGAAEAASAHTALDDAGRDAVVAAALAQSGLSPEDVTAFFADLEANGERPRYQRMIADGKAAIAGLLGDALVTGPRPTLTDLLVRWNDPLNQTGEAQPVTFLLTDIAGSTAMTSEIGNAGAQRVVRAHNAIARAATRAFRGREIKHTGDGMLMIFPDSTAAARAAIDIQQEAATFSLDNPAAPLAVRIGVHTGEAVFEGGEYYGPAVAGVNGICAAAAPGEICCSMAVRQKMPSSLRTETLGAKVLKGSATATEVFKVLWEPRRAAAKGVLEYRQIGAPPAAGAGRG
jgi:adenylate cyclase